MKELQLTITLPSLQVTIPEDQLDIQYLEKFVFQLFKIIGQHILTSILQFLDNQLRKERKRGELSNCGKRSKYLLTLLGNITYQKHLYRDQEGQYRCLLDEALGLKPNQRMSTLIRRSLAYSPLPPAVTAMPRDFSNTVTGIPSALKVSASRYNCRVRRFNNRKHTLLTKT